MGCVSTSGQDRERAFAGIPGKGGRRAVQSKEKTIDKTIDCRSELLDLRIDDIERIV